MRKPKNITLFLASLLLTVLVSSPALGWEEGAILQELPENASKTRLTLPASLADIAMEDYGIGGIGVHSGGHIEGLDHIWMGTRAGVAVGSWGSGTVQQIVNNPSHIPGAFEYHVYIDLGGGLTGIHMELDQVYVAAGETVAAGQAVGRGMELKENVWSAEYSLLDENRTDGVMWGTNAVYVCPFEYLEEGSRDDLVAQYRTRILDVASATGYWPQQNAAWDPYLHNRQFLHEHYPSQLEGEWYSLDKWNQGGAPDTLSFVPASAFHPAKALGREDADMGPNLIDGHWQADYTTGRVLIEDRYATYYGLFALDESQERARLTLELSTTAYPAALSENAWTFIERSRKSRRGDAQELGLL